MLVRHEPGDSCSLQALLDEAVPGTRIVLAPGVYRESAVLRRSGTPEAPIILEAETPGTAIITGADVVAGWRETEPRPCPA